MTILQQFDTICHKHSLHVATTLWADRKWAVYVDERGAALVATSVGHSTLEAALKEVTDSLSKRYGT